MKNFLLFLRNKSYVLIFILLQTISIVLVVKHNAYQNSRFYAITTEISGFFYHLSADIRSFFFLQHTNEDLQKENAELRRNLAESFIFNDTTTRSTQVHSLSYQFYDYIPAQIISLTTQYQNNYVFINVGSLNGVDRGMAVISPNGIVGIVENVSDHFAKVLFVLNERSRVSVALSSSHYSGTLIWKGDHYQEALVVDIPAHADITIGEEIITSGYSLAFPAGICVGHVKEIQELPNDHHFVALKIEFSEDYKKISDVYVVKALYKAELDSLDNL